MELTFKNDRGDLLSLSSHPYFHLINVDGLTSASADLSSITIGGIDGDTVNNAQAIPRTIILDLRIRSGINVEEAKREILKIVKLKKNGTLTWSQSNRTVEINGIVEAVEMPRWENTVTMQITLHCEQPFWSDIDNVVQQINEAIGLHYFTESQIDMLYFPEDGIAFGEIDFSRTRDVYNSGDVAVGMEIEIVAFDEVTNPIIYATDGSFFGIGYGTGAKKVVLSAGDIVRINTIKGAKSVTVNGVNALGKIKPSSTWLQLEAGDNQFSVESDDESIKNMTFYLSYKQRYV